MAVRWEVVRALVIAALLVLLLGAARAGAQPQPVGDGTWTLLDRMPPSEALTEPFFRPARGRAARADYGKLAGVLAKAPMEGTPQAQQNPVTVWLPDPDGNLERFAVVESPVMEAPLYAAHPELRQYRGQGVDDPGATMRLTLSPLGLNAMVLTSRGEPDRTGGAWYVYAYTKGNTELYTAFSLRDAGGEEKHFTCLTADAPGALQRPRMTLRSTLGTTLRQYRLAVATTSEYTAWAGGQAVALAFVQNSVSQLTLIYEREFAVRLVLVANESAIVYPTTSDPFSAPDNPSTTNSQLQTAVDGAIGSANYDLAHVFHRVTTSSSSNGLAGGIGTVCTAGIKGQGYSAYDVPSDPYFVIDYVAHEIGHQFGGRHVFNKCSSTAGESNQYLIEPGSGSTIMSYAGICGTNNLQAHNDAYFNGMNVEQVATYIAAGGACSSNTATGNTPPTAAAGSAYAIPVKTPFALTGAGTDADGDTLSYCWEEQDGSAALTYPPTSSSDTGAGPLVRSKNPLGVPVRLVPQLSTVLNNTTDVQEWLPQVGRTVFKWRLTTRDNRSGGGGVNQSDVTLQVVGAAGPFRVTSQSTSATQSGPGTVTWNVAGTTASPVSCANVKITLSTDAGQTFPTVLAASVPNTGSASVVFPNVTTSTARVKVEAVGNIFYAVNTANFAITPSTPVATFGLAGQPAVNDTGGNGNSSGVIDPGETSVALTVTIQNNGNTTATGVSATLTTSTPTASVTAGTSSYPNMGPGTGGSNAAPFRISVSPSHACGAPINLSLAVTSAQGSSTIPITLSTGSTVTGAVQTRSYTTPAVAIPDNSAAGVNSQLTVSGVGTIGNIKFRFDGSSCSTSATSTTVGLNHAAVGDLVIKLTSPAGTTVTLMNRPGGTANTGNNFCGTVLDDAAASSIQSITSAGQPNTGTFQPANPLSAFNGQSADGVWTLNVADLAAGNTGSVRAWSLVITPQSTTCSPPLTLTGACCAASGSCSVSSQAACAGAYQGDGAACSPNPCPQPMGACCFASGACVVSASGACSGVYQGDGTGCSPNPCPQPMGACCAADGSCVLGVVAACSAGTYQGNGTSCTPTNPCPQPTGSCCAPSGACAVTAQAGCAMGSSWAVGGACSPNPCPQPTGTCCVPDGSCSVTTQVSCAASWTPGAACTPVNPCPQPSGSCCLPSGACSVTQQVHCAGAWASGGGCSPNPCPQPTGACCAADGSCSVATMAACAGTYGGDGAPCTPNPCPQPTFTLSVRTSGQGAGSVTSDPAGVACPGACDFAFTAGTQVTLTAAAAPRGRFLGWSGGCAGTGPCTVTITAATSVTATFRCAADHNGQNGVELSDIFAFLRDYFDGQPAADFNQNGAVELTDIFQFLNAWFAGPC
jgi:subtilisin-like proprotein convertase family protein